ncbi:hypothetical protein Tco_1186184 [Tanacetum coccineum]
MSQKADFHLLSIISTSIFTPLSYRTFKYELSQNMSNLEKQLNNEILHEKDPKSALSVIKVQFDKFIHSDVLKPFDPYSSSTKYDQVRENFKDYTQMEAQTFKETIIQSMNSIDHCIVERASHEQELQNGLKRLNERKLIKATDLEIKSSRSRNECNDKSTSGDDTDIRPSNDTKPMVEVPYTTEYNVFAVDIQYSEQPKCIINTCVVEKVDSNVIIDSPDMCDNEIQTDQNAVECDDERVALANLIVNLKLDIDENKRIQKQLKKANASLTQELKECKSNLAKTSRTLEESNSIRDCCLIALQNKETELEKWIPTRKIFESSTTKVDSKPPHGSDTDITNLQECIQTFDSSASTSINVQEEQNLDLSAGTPFNLKKERINTWTKDNVISGRPRLHGIASLQEISPRPSSQGIRSLLTS